MVIVTVAATFSVPLLQQPSQSPNLCSRAVSTLSSHDPMFSKMVLWILCIYTLLSPYSEVQLDVFVISWHLCAQVGISCMHHCHAWFTEVEAVKLEYIHAPEILVLHILTLVIQTYKLGT